MKRNLEREFDRRRPWTTKFVIRGQEYGGKYDVANDARLKWFRQHFPEAKHILELGSLEGGHSFEIARFPNVERIVAVEGRKANIERARFVQSLLREDKVTFVQANLEKFDLPSLGSFDAVFCVGVLYHLREPWRLIEGISKTSRGLFLWTHYADESKAKKMRLHYRGCVYREWGFLIKPLSSMSPASFWPTRESLEEMLADYGFTQTMIIEDNHDHENGPAIALIARQG